MQGSITEAFTVIDRISQRFASAINLQLRTSNPSLILRTPTATTVRLQNMLSDLLL
jgi:hypothetical protein